MINSKFFALGLLLICPLAFARVQLHTQAEIKNSPEYGNHRADITFNIDVNESLEVYNKDNVRIVAELLAEGEDTAIICFTVYAKNAAGEFEQITSPVLISNYTDPAIVGIGSTNGDSLTITVEARKI